MRSSSKPFWPACACAWLSILGILLSASGRIAAAEPTPSDTAELLRLKELSLEELMDHEVTIVSRTPERLSGAASAVQVIRGEDIQRSGALTLAQALRLAPNLHVAQQNANAWAITARGFNGAPLANNSLADKLLVMIDGRSVYTPLFGGVFWDAQQVLLEDIDRIEVVSGPGGSLWGANAVNGVINIITKSAKDTQGLYLTGGAGSLMQDFGAIRYGGGGTNLFYRVYAQRFDHKSVDLPNGASARNKWDFTQSGFRLDYYPSEENILTFQGDFYGSSSGVPTGTRLDGQNVMGRWQRIFSEESEMSVQVYYDRTWRHVLAPGFADELNTLGFDFQHRVPLGERQSIVWGGEYRLMQNDVRNSVPTSFFPRSRSMQLFSGFVQDEITLVHDRLKLILGTKLEHNDFSEFELQPTARLAWSITPRQTLWAAVSRAVRSPARFDSDVVTPLITGSSHFDSEKVIAYELGYRVRPVDNVTLSLAGFYNEYDHLRSINRNLNPPPALAFENHQEAESWGFEVSGDFMATDSWRLRGGYTFFDKQVHATTPFVVPGSENFEGLDPQSQVLIQSILDLPGDLQFDTVARYVTSLPALGMRTPRVPAYFTFDARLAWTYKQLEFALVGQNLADRRHPEFGALEIPRSVYGQLTFRY